MLSHHKVSHLPSFWLDHRLDGFVRNIASFLDLPDVRETLGIASHIGNFSSCSSDIGMDFVKHLDSLRLTKYYVEGLLERGIQVLVYVGTYDWIWFVLFPLTPLTKHSNHRHLLATTLGTFDGPRRSSGPDMRLTISNHCAIGSLHSRTGRLKWRVRRDLQMA